MQTKLILEQFLPYRINVLANKVSQSLAKAYQQHIDISVAEWRVIVHLSQEENISVREIHAQVHLPRPKITRAVKRLEQMGLVQKKEDSNDRRLVELSLTSEGRMQYQTLEKIALEYQKQWLNNISEADLETYFKVQDQLSKRLDQIDKNRIKPLP